MVQLGALARGYGALCDFGSGATTLCTDGGTATGGSCGGGATEGSCNFGVNKVGVT